VTLRQLGLRSEFCGEAVHLRCCRGDACSPGEVRTERLIGMCVRFLREVAHRQLGRCAPDRPRVGLLEPGQDPEQRRLPHAVRADEADAAAGRHDERDVAEDELRCVMLRDVGCGERAARALQEDLPRKAERKGVCLA
jgi:hypothetical protein